MIYSFNYLSDYGTKYLQKFIDTNKEKITDLRKFILRNYQNKV